MVWKKGDIGEKLSLAKMDGTYWRHEQDNKPSDVEIEEEEVDDGSHCPWFIRQRKQIGYKWNELIHGRVPETDIIIVELFKSLLEMLKENWYI